MALPDCLNCGQPGRRLDHTSAIAWADFYRCDGCGQVWSSDGPTKRRTAKLVIAPKRPGRAWTTTAQSDRAALSPRQSSQL